MPHLRRWGFDLGLIFPMLTHWANLWRAYSARGARLLLLAGTETRPIYLLVIRHCTFLRGGFVAECNRAIARGVGGIEPELRPIFLCGSVSRRLKAPLPRLKVRGFHQSLARCSRSLQKSARDGPRLDRGGAAAATFAGG